MNRGKKLVENTIIIAIGNLSTKVISFFLLPLYTTYLSTNDYGLYDLFLTIAIFLIPIITMLMEESMFRFLVDCKKKEEKRTIISIALNYIIKSIIIFTIIYLILTTFIKIPFRVTFLLYVFSNILVAIKNAVTRGTDRIKAYSLSNFISSLIIITLNIIFIVKYNLGIYGLFLSFIISNVIVSFIVLWKINDYISFKYLNKEKQKEMLKYSIPLVPNSLSWTIINLSDRIIVSTILGSSINGIYSMSYKFPNLMDTFYGFFYTAWKENAARSLKDSDREAYYNKVYCVLKKFMWAIVLSMIVVLSLIFNILIKNDFTSSYLYIPILIISMYFSNISGYYGGIFSAFKDTKIMGITTIVGAILNILINIIFIKIIGIWAAAISTLLSTFVVYIIRKIKLRRHIHLKENFNLYLSSLVMLLISLLGYYLNIIYIKIICLLLIIIYCLYLNREVIQIVLKRIVSFRKKAK